MVKIGSCEMRITLDKKNTKQKISECFKEIEKIIPNSKVLNSNSKDPLPVGLRGFVDHMIVTWKYIVFVEDKYEDTKDKLSDEQKKLQRLLLHHASLNKNIHYFVVKNFEDAQKIKIGIIQEDL
jgi:hypothetical protein